jgi:alpha-galactosidase
MFGHMGVEWNLLTLRDDQQQQLRHIIDLYKQHRELPMQILPIFYILIKFNLIPAVNYKTLNW